MSMFLFIPNFLYVGLFAFTLFFVSVYWTPALILNADRAKSFFLVFFSILLFVFHSSSLSVLVLYVYMCVLCALLIQACSLYARQQHASEWIGVWYTCVSNRKRCVVFFSVLKCTLFDMSKPAEDYTQCIPMYMCVRTKNHPRMSIKGGASAL